MAILTLVIIRELKIQETSQSIAASAWEEVGRTISHDETTC